MAKLPGRMFHVAIPKGKRDPIGQDRDHPWLVGITSFRNGQFCRFKSYAELNAWLADKCVA